MAASGKERIEGLAADVEGHTIAFICNNNLYIVRACTPHHDIDVASSAIRECVRNGVQQ